jgi:hypothetical protein
MYSSLLPFLNPICNANNIRKAYANRHCASQARGLESCLSPCGKYDMLRALGTHLLPFSHFAALARQNHYQLELTACCVISLIWWGT